MRYKSYSACDSQGQSQIIVLNMNFYLLQKKEKKERIVTENDLKKRYSCMTRNPLIKFIIKNTFDSNINFID